LPNAIVDSGGSGGGYRIDPPVVLDCATGMERFGVVYRTLPGLSDGCGVAGMGELIKAFGLAFDSLAAVDKQAHGSVRDLAAHVRGGVGLVQDWDRSMGRAVPTRSAGAGGARSAAGGLTPR